MSLFLDGLLALTSIGMREWMPGCDSMTMNLKSRILRLRWMVLTRRMIRI